MGDWFIEWYGDVLYVTHDICGGTHEIRQGPSSHIYLDNLHTLINRHRCWGE